jgi:hypothetical protein
MTDNSHESTARIARYAQHITQLARAFNVKLVVEPQLRPDQAGAGFMMTKDGVLLKNKPFIRVLPVTDETSYAAPLHEMGHMLHPTGHLTDQASKTFRDSVQTAGIHHAVFADFRDVRLLLESERSAWEWAKQYALEWTPTMDAVRVMCMKSYIHIAKRVGLKGEWL